jgi:hypothetical protein
MLRTVTALGAAVGALLLIGAAPDQALYHMRSRDQGISAFDVSVTETKREERTSILKVPGFHDRSAAAARWLMCAYTDLAIQRGFDYWAVLYPALPSEELLLGFPKSEKKEDVAALGSRFAGEGDAAPIVASVDRFSRFCGMKRPQP